MGFRIDRPRDQVLVRTSRLEAAAVLSLLFEKYGHKIQTVGALRQTLGTRPRLKTVVMCHGVFDIVHPGHLRHMLFARSKADILVASLTADRHIAKGEDRPHIPQEMRALNLAAFEAVDYVLVDDNPTPIENIELLQPDFFAKGYEYAGARLAPKTQEEASAVRLYGGEMVFTPGDIVYSSTQLINAARPAIAHERLLSLMDSESLTFDALRSALARLGQYKVHVVGDTIVDSYTHTSMLGAQSL